MTIITRDQWGARPRGATRSSHPIGYTIGITAHWEGPHMGDFSHSACAGKVRGIEAFHRDGRGWADIAYNAIVCPHGYVFEGRGPGVTSAANGYTKANDDWYAVCYLGGERDGFTDAGRDGFLTAFGWLKDKGGAGPKRNGHRDHKATTCPGPEIYAWVHGLPDGAGDHNQEDEMNADQEKLLKDTNAHVNDLTEEFAKFRKNVLQRDKNKKARDTKIRKLLEGTNANVDAVLAALDEE